MDKISIIVPIYNVEPYIHKCVDSILNQTYKNIEVILVDDGSPDNCGKICDEYAEKDDRVVVIHKENGGLSDARNAGLDKATGKYVGFVDSDDYIAPNMYEKLYTALKENDAEIAVCGVVKVLDGVFYASNNSFNIVMTGREFLLNTPPKINVNIVCNKLFTKCIFDNIRYPKGRLYEDAFIMHKIMLNAKQIICLSDNLYYYVKRSDSIMRFKIEIKNMVDRTEAFLYRAAYYMQENCPNEHVCDSLATGLYYCVNSYSECRNQEGAKEKYKKLVKMYRKSVSFKILKGVPILKVIRICSDYVFPYPTEKTVKFLKKIKNIKKKGAQNEQKQTIGN